ncbi:MAG: TldD/PmbA family protein [Acidimicrobiia bacterium]|nr:TldD/PmbA family protein [Acidimicrobiia bacterium]
MIDAIEERFRRHMPDDTEYCSMRYFEERGEHLVVRQGVTEPIRTSLDAGAMITVWSRGGLGYAATSDLTDAGIADAVTSARRWAHITAGVGVIDTPPLGHHSGEFLSPVERSWETVELADRIDLLEKQCAALEVDDRIVDWDAELWLVDRDSLLLTSGGGRVVQQFQSVFPSLSATANNGSNTQRRTYGGGAFSGQGGIEVLDRHGFATAAHRIGEQAIELLAAPNCPAGATDLVLAPDQMVLQIHESIGHPLELDRILGDERNYAGTSFVTPDMFGAYVYGSDLLNVTFDPTVRGQIASYGFDDDGTPAERQYLIRGGVLERPLGGTISQARAGMDGVASSRASSWNRPPIDRMANLNVEPGDSTFGELISSVERGVYMETNNSWSIDDSRNKFQFGCEWARLIEDGELTTVVRNPSYRGISATFWRSLDGVADADSNTVMGVPNCGKGEPNQQIWVGHASPACLFRAVDVFGGEQ